jgi:hypothetical protein
MGKLFKFQSIVTIFVLFFCLSNHVAHATVGSISEENIKTADGEEEFYYHYMYKPDDIVDDDTVTDEPSLTVLLMSVRIPLLFTHPLFPANICRDKCTFAMSNRHKCTYHSAAHFSRSPNSHANITTNADSHLLPDCIPHCITDATTLSGTYHSCSLQ